MKIIVDKLPEKPNECLFSGFLGGDKYSCHINCNNPCKLIKNNKCDMLKSFDHLHIRNFRV